MTFGEAIQLLKQGKLVQRAGWNGKGMFIFQRPADTLSVETIVEHVKSLPKSVKEYYQGVCGEAEASETYVLFTGYLCMKAADNTIVNGWLASQTDMLAEDWVEFKVEK